MEQNYSLIDEAFKLLEEQYGNCKAIGKSISATKRPSFKTEV